MSRLAVSTITVKRLARRRVSAHYLYVAPALIVTLAVMIYPLSYSLWLSTHRFSLKRPDEISFLGLQNYVNVLVDEVFHTAILNTLVYMAGAVTVEFFLGFGLALLLNRALPAEGLLRTSFLIPIVLTPVVAALMATYLLNPDFGIVNYLLGRQAQWLGDPRLAMISIIALDVWRTTPFVFLVLLAGLQTVPAERYEAAAIDGANSWQTLRHVVLRQLRPLIMIVLLIRIMDVFREFDTPFVLTGGGPGNATEMIALYTYRIGFKYLDMGYAAALSLTMLAVVLGVCYLFVRQLQASREA